MSFDDEEVFEGAEKFLVDKYNHKEDEVSKVCFVLLCIQPFHLFYCSLF